MTNLVQTEFNSNTATLERIDRALKSAAQYAHMEDYVSWYKSLMFLRREAIVKMRDDDREECDKLFDDLSNNVELYRSTHANKARIVRLLHKKLDYAEIFLRDFMDAKGMLLRDGNDAKTALMRG